MSSALAIAATTAVLRSLIDNGLKARNVGDLTGGAIAVTALAPDRITLGANEPTQVNLFLYQVAPNAGWRNNGLPTRDSRGDRIANAPLALDLHYLLTAYGANELFPEIVLGHAMQLLHETAAVPRQTIRKVLVQLADPDLRTSELAEQVEQIKITPQQLSIDDTSKLWSALSAHYRPSATYIVTTALIESQRSARVAMPVLQRQIAAHQLRRPVITSLSSDAGEGLPITPSENLIIQGTALKADLVTVLINETDVSGSITLQRDDEIQITLAAAAGLRAGAQVVQVVHDQMAGAPATRRPLVESNAEVFVLHPALAAAVLTAVGSVENGVAIKAGTIQLTFDPPVTPGQRIVLLLNEAAPAAGVPPRAYSFVAVPGNGIVPPATETDTVTVAYRSVEPGDYLVRAQVSGAESVLDVDANGVFAAPKVTI